MRPTVNKLTALPRARKRAVIVGFDTVAMSLALWLAFCIRYGELYTPVNRWVVPLAAAAVALGVGALLLLGIYKVVVRYMDVHAALRIAVGAGAVAAIWFILAYVSRVENLPRSVGFIYFGIVFLFMFFGRLAAARLLNEEHHSLLRTPGTADGQVKETRVAIYGATSAGSSLAEALRRHPEYRLRCFVDDNPALVGRFMVGAPIRSLEQLRQEVQSGAVEQVFLAIQSATRSDRMAALASLSGLGVPVMTIPSYEEIMSGRYTISDVRPINVEDLLKRDIVPPLRELIEEGLRGKSILVTGAGGSIGSEICRQVVQHRPRRLVLLDHSEFALFSIETELRALCDGQADGPALIPIIGTLLNERLVREILADHAIDAVFHAAAYKHVPLLELNEVVGVTNNVVGTRILADACVDARIPRLTMISTDKAVRPTNVMGRSKRVAELYIQALAREPDVPTQFGIVRFGNVLDSSGSVVQRFRSQISEGGPVTVTHADITRFFMSIPEATQLVLQANSLAAKGEVFVLDMGEPVRIADLARTMIALSGMTEKTPEDPDGDIEISYVGLRPGEKLHEELFVGEVITETVHPQIKMAEERSMPLEELVPHLRRLDMALEAHDPRAVRTLLSKILELDFAERRGESETLPETIPPLNASRN
ncbi:nucleoside-diphosphate sugar epimerase/dehydratase [Sphingosinicella sp. CPCC 101087]|uniref:nucleoside-diphosphate sugar epimerase/dehydratase n=1 Tax=Sphingosinicella sp. CPCC 101087 TaxID=2497754 RepID=UPI00101CD379|nr:nucleoside-diphosphate sugar epimerase/dehydratase [Sphingosinicella sp. CPCC 101087]